jgi:hypothetical protein
MKVETRKHLEKLIEIIEEFEQNGGDAEYATVRIFEVCKEIVPKKAFALAYWTTLDIKDFFSEEKPEQELEDILSDIEDDIRDTMISSGWEVVNEKMEEEEDDEDEKE